jgi:hypothetical protein
MASSKGDGEGPRKDFPTQQQVNAFKKEIAETHIWARARVVAYSHQRDRWQRGTYWLLGASAILAAGAAISAGLSVHLLSVIFAGISAALSVLTASLKTVSRVSQAEKSHSEVTILSKRIRALETDLDAGLQDLSLTELKLRVEEVRKQTEEAGTRPQPSLKELKEAVAEIGEFSPGELATLAPNTVPVGRAPEGRP